ncbi:MiaB/RimO family radical SAM methylthiotransferase [Sphingomonas cannabina]|uniref:MiaB/RimO family radical SAM methylthiotransferase n=1 Tax=Sphingomonas cannabina TaxID=2899123 RepID=UPI001F18A24D|nr:MiaB/RimO family radical SAM methylthiotransferase [Sphingomonas cannabina]UIJ44133.1 MiaB/RimO family radical SAM methylthiotransferase [Sphingomonas cannabina]
MLAPSAGPEVITLGCRLNIAESESIRAMLGSRDVVVVNSCAVTNEAIKATRAAIRRARRARPHAELVVTGCAATIDPDGFAAMAEVDRVVGNMAKLDAAAWGGLEMAPARFTGHARAFVEVQNGCDHRCTFCAIPYGRGPSRSVPAGAVVERIAALVAAGHREVVLTGVDVTSYGADLPGAPSFGSLVERILRHTAVERLRLSSLDSIEIDERLFELLTGEARVMPHVHLSLQAGDDMILKRMKRRHSRAKAVAIVERLKARRPEIAIGADLIAGFPTEDEAMFANTLAILDDCDVVHPHIFPFSSREGTPAARMPQVAREVVKARAGRLREAGEARRRQWLAALVGTEQRVLVERPGDRGHAENFAEVRLDRRCEPGTMARAAIHGSDDTSLLSSVIPAQAGIHSSTSAAGAVDPGLRRGDDMVLATA